MNFNVIKNVRLFSDGGYLVTLEIGEEGSTEEVEFVARVNGGGICDEVLEQINLGNFEGEITDYVPPTPVAPVFNYSLAEIFDAMTDQEYTLYKEEEPDILNSLSARERGIYERATSLVSNHPLFPTFYNALVSGFGETRTEELLTAARL